MFAKINFRSFPTTPAGYAQHIRNLALLLSGHDLNDLMAENPTIDPSLSYVLTSKFAAGWTMEYDNPETNTYVLSAPCPNGRKKYLGITHSSNAIRFDIGSSFNSSTGVILDIASRVSQSHTNLYAGSTNIDLFVSSSQHHIVITAGNAGQEHAYNNSSYWTNAYCLFDYISADTWMFSNEVYIPTAHLYNGSGTIFYAPPHPNLAGTALVSSPQLLVQTRRTAGHLGASLDSAYPGYNPVMYTESGIQPVLMPFGLSNTSTGVRGGSVTDLCDVYLAPTGFAPNAIIRPADSDIDFHIISNALQRGQNLAVPRG